MACSVKETGEVVSAALYESRRLVSKKRLSEAVSVLEKASPDCETASFAVHCKFAKRLATLCNLSEGSESLGPKVMRAAEKALQRAEERRKKEGARVDEELLRLTLLTYNNWANYHKERKNYHMALNFLMRATKLIETLGAKSEADTLEFCAKTRLNISALYSDLRRYREAAEHAELCLSILQQEMTLRTAGRHLSTLSPSERTQFDAMITTFVVAFYNIGVAEENLGLSANALQAYRNAISIGSKFLPPTNPELFLAQRALARTPQRRSSLLSSLSPLETEEVRLLLVTQQSTDTDCVKPSFAAGSRTMRDTGKYYSEDRLKKLHDRLVKGERLDFVSADKFFLTKIVRNLNVEGDVKHMRSMSA